MSVHRPIHLAWVITLTAVTCCFVGCGSGEGAVAGAGAGGSAGGGGGATAGTGGSGATSGTGGALLSTRVDNNAFFQAATDELCVDVRSNSTTMDSNAYSDQPSPCFNGTDANALVSSDFELTVDSTAYNPVRIASSSPLVNKGNTDVREVTVNGETFTVVEDDFYLNPRDRNVDIGAVEYIAP